jgi:hypothetical protein
MTIVSFFSTSRRPETSIAEHTFQEHDTNPTPF